MFLVRLRGKRRDLSGELDDLLVPRPRLFVEPHDELVLLVGGAEEVCTSPTGRFRSARRARIQPEKSFLCFLRRPRSCGKPAASVFKASRLSIRLSSLISA